MVVGIADHHVEHHLSVKPLEVLPRLHGNMPDYLCQIPVAGIVISVGLEQRLHADQVIATASFVDIEMFYNSYRLYSFIGYKSPNNYEKEVNLSLAA